VAVGPTRRRRSAWLVVLGAIAAVFVVLVAVAVLVAFTWFDVSLSDGVGDRSYAPASAADVHRSYALGVGDLKVDLSGVGGDRRLRVDAHVGIGSLRVTVPPDMPVVVDAHVKAGSVDALGRSDDGRNARVRIGGSGQLHVDARVGAGSIDVVRGR
jgi:predicted membrane protein